MDARKNLIQESLCREKILENKLQDCKSFMRAFLRIYQFEYELKHKGKGVKGNLFMMREE